MSSDTPKQAAQMTICTGPDVAPQEAGHWYSEAYVADLRQQLETERMRLAACSTAALGYFTDCLPEYRSAALEDVLQLRQQLVEQDALVERMQSVIEDLEVYAACFIEGTTPKISIENAREDFADAEAVISFTPSSALSEHDAEVRRKVLEEVVELWEAPYNGDTFSAQLRRMAAEKREGE